MLLAQESLETAELFIAQIHEHVRYEFAGMGIETEQGVYQRYNGIDVTQTRDYIKVGCESYIDRVLLSHGWDAPKVKDPPNLVPISTDAAHRLVKLEGPLEKTPEAKSLAKLQGFSYRNVLGELIYAYVIARLDIGYAICLLARFSGAPHGEHYHALKNVCRYLRATKSWGIIYQRPRPLMGLLTFHLNSSRTTPICRVSHTWPTTSFLLVLMRPMPPTSMPDVPSLAS